MFDSKEKIIALEKRMRVVRNREIVLGNRSDEEILKDVGNLGMIFEYDVENSIQVLQLEVLLDIRRTLNKDYEMKEY